VGWPDEGNHTGNMPPVTIGGTFPARPVVKQGSLVKASGLNGVYRVTDIRGEKVMIVQEIPNTGQSTYIPMSDLRVWTNKPIKEQGVAEGLDQEFNMQLAKILKQRGYKGPVKLEQLGMKWVKAIGDIVDIDDYIMVQGNDPEYDGWVSYVFGLGKYAYGAEQGYTTGTAKRVEIDTRDEQGLAEESPYMDDRPSSVTAKQADEFGGAAKRAFKPEYYEPDTEPAPKSRSWDYSDPDVKPIVDKYLNDKILDKKPMTYRQDVPEDFDDLDRFMKAKYGPKPSGGSGIKRGTYGQPGRRRGRPTGATGGEGSGIPQAVEFDRPHSERSAGRRLPRFSDDYDAIRRSEVDEGSAQDRLHRRHQELRKKSGLPDPDYY
jgi:hypothetical protein